MAGADPGNVARALRRSRARCIAVDLDLRDLASSYPSAPLAEAREQVRSLSRSLDATAAQLEAAHGLAPQDADPPRPRVVTARERALSDLAALRKRAARAG